MKDISIYRSCAKQFLHPISLCLIIISLSICSVTLGLDSNDADIKTLSSVFFFFFFFFFRYCVAPTVFCFGAGVFLFCIKKIGAKTGSDTFRAFTRVVRIQQVMWEKRRIR